MIKHQCYSRWLWLAQTDYNTDYTVTTQPALKNNTMVTHPHYHTYCTVLLLVTFYVCPDEGCKIPRFSRRPGWRIMDFLLNPSWFLESSNRNFGKSREFFWSSQNFATLAQTEVPTTWDHHPRGHSIKAIDTLKLLCYFRGLFELQSVAKTTWFITRESSHFNDSINTAISCWCVNVRNLG